MNTQALTTRQRTYEVNIDKLRTTPEQFRQLQAADARKNGNNKVSVQEIRDHFVASGVSAADAKKLETLVLQKVSARPDQKIKNFFSKYRYAIPLTGTTVTLGTLAAMLIPDPGFKALAIGACAVLGGATSLLAWGEPHGS